LDASASYRLVLASNAEFYPSMKIQAPVIGQEEWWDIVHLSRPKQWKSALRQMPLFCLTAAHKLDTASPDDFMDVILTDSAVNRSRI
jgi:hypothetical protein